MRPCIEGLFRSVFMIPSGAAFYDFAGTQVPISTLAGIISTPRYSFNATHLKGFFTSIT